jgi:hypothetical protein
MQINNGFLRAVVFILICILWGLSSLAGCGPSDRMAAQKSSPEKQAPENITTAASPNSTKTEGSPQVPPKCDIKGKKDVAEKKFGDKKKSSDDKKSNGEEIIGREQNLALAAAAAENAQGWKILFDGKTLEGWKVTKFDNEGVVKIEDGAILMEQGDPMTGITWTGELPRENYELELDGMRVRENDFFCTTTFPVGEAPCSLVVGGWGGSVVGLSSVDGYDASENPTTKILNFTEKQWYHMRIRVTEKTVQAWIDDREVVHQGRDGHHFSIRFEVNLSKPLGIAAWNTVGAVRNIRLRQLTPEEIAAGKKEIKDDKDNS